MKKLLPIAVVAVLFASCRTQEQKAQNFNVNYATSKAEWKGSAPDHFHVGSFNVSGNLAVTPSGLVKSGDFVIPIASIQNFDLQEPVRQVLLADLKDNFFKLALHPDAKFHLTSVAPYSTADTSAVTGANYQLTGDFTMLGQTHRISFPAKIIAKGDSVLTEAKLNIDRNKWGMNNYNDPTKALYILPDVNIHLSIKAKAAQPEVNPLAIIGFRGFNN